ncbi:MAG: WG repeat-containing protein [Bacteroidales bacterium]
MGFIDTKGEIIIPIKYDDVNCFNGGYARVYVDDEWIKISKYGEVL